MKKYWWLGGLVVLAAAGFIINSQNNPVTADLYFFNGVAAADANFTSPELTRRTIFKKEKTPDAVLRLLLAGPTKEEIEQGLIDTFDGTLASTIYQKDLESLLSYYQGITISDGAAVVDFSKEAFTTLSGSPSLQSSVKVPIEQTLKQFLEIKEVKYSLDGEIFDDWDA